MKLKSERIIDMSEIDSYNGVGIYAIVNCDNGKMYIGSSKHIYRRIIEHDYSFRVKECNKKILVDLIKGHKFKAVILYKEENHCNGNDLRIKEKEYIIKHDAFVNGYNVAFTTKREHEKKVTF